MTAQPTSFSSGSQTWPPVLAWGDGQTVARPVEVGELEPLDVDAAQPEPGDQQDDRVVAFPARVAPVDRVQDRGHVAGVPDRRDPGLPAGRHRRDRLSRGGAGQALPGREPQEGPQRAQLLLDGLGLVAGQRGDKRPDHRGVAAGQPAAGAGEPRELRDRRPVSPHRRGAPLRSPQPGPEPGNDSSIASGQLADRARVMAHHGAVELVVAQHLGDPEQVHVGLLERSGLLLGEEAAAGLIDPLHGHVQRELLHAAGREVPLQTAPGTVIPDHRRVLVAQADHLRLQAGHQHRQGDHRPTPDHARPGPLPSPMNGSSALCAALARRTGHKQARKSGTAHKPALRIRRFMFS